jgi:hypothetical protein
MVTIPKETVHHARRVNNIKDHIVNDQELMLLVIGETQLGRLLKALHNLNFTAGLL